MFFVTKFARFFWKLERSLDWAAQKLITEQNFHILAKSYGDMSLPKIGSN